MTNSCKKPTTVRNMSIVENDLNYNWKYTQICLYSAVMRQKSYSLKLQQFWWSVVYKRIFCPNKSTTILTNDNVQCTNRRVFFFRPQLNNWIQSSVAEILYTRDLSPKTKSSPPSWNSNLPYCPDNSPHPRKGGGVSSDLWRVGKPLVNNRIHMNAGRMSWAYNKSNSLPMLKQCQK